ncbi:MAG: T9SS type A sorting domain-containing protein [Brumimicrobium sp.]
MKYLVITLTCLFSITFFTTFSQMSPKAYNYNNFSEGGQEISEEMLDLIPSDYHNHPEFGKLPYNAPCDDCFELIHKRTDTTKMFVGKGTNGTHFYSQATLGLVHYEKDGRLLTYDPRLKPLSSGVYKSENQDTPTFIDINEENTGFEINNKQFKFNNKLELYLIKEDGAEVSLGIADWSNHTVGEEGIKVIDAWEGIDITVSFGLDKIKTNYVIDSPLDYLDDIAELKFSDNIILPDNYEMEEGDDELIDSEGNRFGSYDILNSQGENVFKIHKAFGYDKSEIKERSRSFYYELDETFNLFVPVDWITSDSTVFPLTIDPLVTSTGTQTAGWMSFFYNGAWCGGAGSCNYNLTVPKPANSTITGTTMDAVYESLGGYCAATCWMNEAGFKVTSPCGISPAPAATFWSCNAPNPGTCTAAGFDVYAELGSCLGAACSGNVTFQIQNSYCFCSLGGNCGDNCQWMPNNTWSMTLEGHTLETLGNTATGNGTETINTSDCSGSTTLDPDVLNGVPGYTYSWSNGQTASTINVSNASGAHTVDVTDACGVTRTATFEVNCPLAVTLANFTTENLGESVFVEWETKTERDNDYFQILRSDNGETFEVIGEVDGAGNSNSPINYSFKDKKPLNNISYYQLAIVDINGETEYSSIESVNRLSGNTALQLIPNPASEKVDVVFDFPTSGNFDLIISDMMGNKVFEDILSKEKGTQNTNVNTSQFRSGTYNVQLITKNKVYSAKLVVE